MTFSAFLKRLGLTTFMIVLAGSVAAFDVACCGNGTDPDPGIVGPNDLAPAPNDGGDDPEPEESDTADAGGGEGITEALLDACREIGGAYVAGRQCFDRDGHFLRM